MLIYIPGDHVLIGLPSIANSPNPSAPEYHVDGGESESSERPIRHQHWRGALRQFSDWRHSSSTQIRQTDPSDRIQSRWKVRVTCVVLRTYANCRHIAVARDSDVHIYAAPGVFAHQYNPFLLVHIYHLSNENVTTVCRLRPPYR